MNRLFTPGIECTDPDSLQFCLRISNTKYWYCQPNIYHRDLFPGADTPARHILCRYLGDPNDFLRDMHTDAEVRAFASDRMLWMESEIDAADFSQQEQEALLADYGYRITPADDKDDVLDSCWGTSGILASNGSKTNPDYDRRPDRPQKGT